MTDQSFFNSAVNKEVLLQLSDFKEVSSAQKLVSNLLTNVPLIFLSFIFRNNKQFYSPIICQQLTTYLTTVNSDIDIHPVTSIEYRLSALYTASLSVLNKDNCLTAHDKQWKNTSESDVSGSSESRKSHQMWLSLFQAFFQSKDHSLDAAHSAIKNNGDDRDQPCTFFPNLPILINEVFSNVFTSTSHWTELFGQFKSSLMLLVNVLEKASSSLIDAGQNWIRQSLARETLQFYDNILLFQSDSTALLQYVCTREPAQSLRALLHTLDFASSLKVQNPSLSSSSSHSIKEYFKKLLLVLRETTNPVVFIDGLSTLCCSCFNNTPIQFPRFPRPNPDHVLLASLYELLIYPLRYTLSSKESPLMFHSSNKTSLLSIEEFSAIFSICNLSIQASLFLARLCFSRGLETWISKSYVEQQYKKRYPGHYSRLNQGDKHRQQKRNEVKAVSSDASIFLRFPSLLRRESVLLDLHLPSWLDDAESEYHHISFSTTSGPTSHADDSRKVTWAVPMDDLIDEILSTPGYVSQTLLIHALSGEKSSSS